MSTTTSGNRGDRTTTDVAALQRLPEMNISTELLSMRVTCDAGTCSSRTSLQN
ncbi:hypothetical protein [Nocardia sp. NPDC005998]|uniref:hypothetical protein n=1 Tax=Nocardia sp. NPDC005998 TaxID=3156894 RepID=UPI0033B99788